MGAHTLHITLGCLTLSPPPLTYAHIRSDILAVVPSKAGTQGQPLTLHHQFVVEVAPLRVMALNQCELPRAPPFLEPLFAQDGGLHGVMNSAKTSR